MSKIDDLINKLCPNGVEYKAIQDLCNISRGRVMSKDYIKNNVGDYPVYSSQTENNGELGKIATYDFDGEYLTWTTDGANAGSVFYRNGKFSVTNVCGLLEVINSTITTKFLYYVLSIEAPKYVNAGMGNPKLMSNVMSRIKVAVPPLDVQCEIVRILDDFMSLSTELSSELIARKKQYEFYRRSLLAFEDDNLEYIELKDLFNTKNGYTPSKSNKEYWEDGTVSWYRMEDIRENGRVLSNSIQKVNKKGVKGSLFPKNSIIISTSATIGEHALITEDFLCNQRFTCLTLKDCYKNKFDIKFLFYYCFVLGEWCLNNLNQGNFASVDMKLFNKFKFPMLDIDKQKKIVNVLEKLDNLCNSTSDGIPAEIDARKKQYDFYRNKLLTFKELVNEG